VWLGEWFNDSITLEDKDPSKRPELPNKTASHPRRPESTFVFPQSLNIARTAHKKPRHLYENEDLNVRVPYMRRSLFKYIITTDDKHAVKATAVSPTKTYTPSRERKGELDHLYY